MKVWELMNQIKGTNADMETILDWMVMSKICPLEVPLELETGPQPMLCLLAATVCGGKTSKDCNPDCYKEFLLEDIPEEVQA